jgi:NADPH:quinone reductase-like Zn-dependent oxidoreductase
MTEKMKALVKSRPEPGLWLEEVPIPEIGINDVLVEIFKTAICGTDIHIYNWNECRWAMSSWAGWPRSAVMSMILSPVTWFPVKATWFAAAAETVWPADATCACAPAALELTDPVPMPNI